MGRYTLTMETFNRQIVTINLLEDNQYKEKVSLRTIDKYTTKSTSRDDLIKRINSNEKIKSIKITYIQNGMIKEVPLAYKDKSKLNDVKLEKGSNISLSNTVFQSTMSKLLDLLNKRDFFSLALNSSLLTLKQKEYIEKIFVDGEYSEFNKNKLYSYSAPYRQFRNILFLIEQYEVHKKIEEERKVTIEDDEDDYEDVWLSEEEKEKYEQYLESLPDGIPDYMDRYL